MVSDYIEMENLHSSSKQEFHLPNFQKMPQKVKSSSSLPTSPKDAKSTPLPKPWESCKNPMGKIREGCKKSKEGAPSPFEFTFAIPI